MPLGERPDPPRSAARQRRLQTVPVTQPYPAKAGALTTGTVGRAVAYARYGWPVFPCRPGGKEPATRHGFRDATTDPDQIRWWWRRQPEANVAIATGSPGPDVLDVDQHGEAGSGFAALNLLKRSGLIERYLAVVGTPSGGLHIYFAGSDQSSGRLRNCHLDFRARGGYVVAPPSQVGGRPYQVMKYQAQTGGLDWQRAVGLVEPERARTAGRAGQAHHDAHRLAEWLATQGPESHNRNDGLFWAACRAAEAQDEGTLAELAAVARGAGLGDHEIRRTIESARRTAARGQAFREAAT